MEMELRRPRPMGFTMVEVLVAGALLMVITLGTLPLFTRALRDNRSGAESTEVSNAARSGLEEFFQLPWDAARLVLAALPDCDPATCAVPADDPARWTRVTCVRQFSNDDVTDDGELADDEALAFDADPSQVHLKEIVVRVASARQSPVFGPAKRITVRTLKSQ